MQFDRYLSYRLRMFYGVPGEPFHVHPGPRRRTLEDFYARLERAGHAFGESQHEHTDVRQVPIPVHSHEENEA